MYDSPVSVLPVCYLAYRDLNSGHIFVVRNRDVGNGAGAVVRKSPRRQRCAASSILIFLFFNHYKPEEQYYSI